MTGGDHALPPLETRNGGVSRGWIVQPQVEAPAL